MNCADNLILHATASPHPPLGVLLHPPFHLAAVLGQHPTFAAWLVTRQGQDFLHVVLRAGPEQTETVADGIGLRVAHGGLPTGRVEQRVEVAALVEAVAHVPE
ncbi:MAG: hypothetical protein EBT61_01185 [Verrucomicrobia bacterium]|nr:hypothetical protein [Verrucomicrobiota bacterium]